MSPATRGDDRHRDFLLYLLLSVNEEWMKRRWLVGWHRSCATAQVSNNAVSRGHCCQLMLILRLSADLYPCERLWFNGTTWEPWPRLMFTLATVIGRRIWLPALRWRVWPGVRGVIPGVCKREGDTRGGRVTRAPRRSAKAMQRLSLHRAQLRWSDLLCFAPGRRAVPLLNVDSLLLAWRCCSACQRYLLDSAGQVHASLPRWIHAVQAHNTEYGHVGNFGGYVSSSHGALGPKRAEPNYGLKSFWISYNCNYCHLPFQKWLKHALDFVLCINFLSFARDAHLLTFSAILVWLLNWNNVCDVLLVSLMARLTTL